MFLIVQVTLDSAVSQVLLELAHLATQVYRVLLDHRDRWVSLAIQGYRDSQATPVHRDRLEKQETLGQPDPRATADQ